MAIDAENTNISASVYVIFLISLIKNRSTQFSHLVNSPYNVLDKKITLIGQIQKYLTNKS